jgi:hypothetical protein
MRPLKTLLTSFLLLLYVLSTAGVAVSAHFCNDALKDLKLYSKTEDCCGKKARAHNCCSEQSFFVRINDVHHIQHAQQVPKATECAILFLNEHSIASFSTETITDALLSPRTPPPPNRPLHILLRTFLI